MDESTKTAKPVNQRRQSRRHRKRNPFVIQEHHITYSPEWTVKVYKGEHWVVTQMQRRKNWSQGFIQAVEYLLDKHRANAVDLGPGKTPPG